MEQVHKRFAVAAIALIVGFALVRASWTTRLDGFTIDEPWNIVSGVAHARLLDFRLNAEQGPFIYMWAGAMMDESTLRLPPFRKITDKYDERRFVEEIVFLQNDPDRIQRRARSVMLLFSAMLLTA